jgi:hypothetical protein
LGIGLAVLVRSSGYAAATAGGVLLAASPAFWSEWIFESDLLVNAIVVAVGIGWALYAVTRKGASAWWHLVGSAALCGVGFTDRIIFAALVPLVLVVLWRVRPTRAVCWGLTTGFVGAVLVVVPMMLVGSELDQTMRNFAKADSSIPYSGAAVAALMVTVAVVGALRVRTVAGVYGTAAAVMLPIPLGMVVLESIAAGTLVIDTYLARTYWPIPLLFVVVALVVRRWSITRADDGPVVPAAQPDLSLHHGGSWGAHALGG